ncbi:MAG: PilZ domain-containing protein [Desulfonatronovibrio sp. MSAO_Bac4]|nr:MAG: PilZ domain-containing protein [Desulfonatronovibrio sp. MSAO_Bac4]
MSNEKRKRLRVEVKFPVVVHQGKIRVISMSRDISLKGLLSDYRPEFKTGEPCSISIKLSSGIAIDIDCMIAASSSRGTAFDFIKMDEQSFYHLHNLIKLHAKNPDRVDGELLNPAFDEGLLKKYLNAKLD